MPYDIVKRGSKFCVVKRDGGKALGCHPTRTAAVRQMRAIYASESKHHPAEVFEMGGARYMLLVSTNGYKDRQDEYVSARAMKAFIDRQWDESGFHGDNVMLFWHKGPAIGDIVWANQEGPFTVEVARERKSGLPLVAAYTEAIWNYLESPDEPYGASIGFGYLPEDREPDQAGAVYRSIRKFETSVLPLKFAANPYTFSGVLPNMTTKREEELEKITGLRGLLEPLRRVLSGASDTLADEGKEHKSIDGTATLTREDLLDVVELAVKGVLNAAAEIATKADEGEPAPVDLRAMAGAALDEYMAVPTVDLQTAADILAVNDADETAEVEGADAQAEAAQAADEAQAVDETAPASAAVTDKALETTLALNQQLMADQAEIVKAFQTVIPALSGLAGMPDAVKSLGDSIQGLTNRVTELESEFKQRPRASVAAATRIDLPDAIKTALMEEQREADNFYPKA